jgi:hypothetical protein
MKRSAWIAARVAGLSAPLLAVSGAALALEVREEARMHLDTVCSPWSSSPLDWVLNAFACTGGETSLIA